MAATSDREHLEEVKQEYQYGFHDTEHPVFKASRGISHEVVEQISAMKREPEWMREFRHRCAGHLPRQVRCPPGARTCEEIDFDDIYYYMQAHRKAEKNWDDIPTDIKRTFDRLGIPEAERKFLAGVGAQYESEVVYHSLQEQWSKLGVIFLDTDGGLREHEDIVASISAR
jgi:Fe-S cluster assembly protein SufB